jgi:hypothetical protein
LAGASAASVVSAMVMIRMVDPGLVRFRANRTLSRHGRSTEFDPIRSSANNFAVLQKSASMW